MHPGRTPTCFVMTPFKEPYDSIYQKILAPAIVQAQMKPVRADEILQPGDAVAQVWTAIRDADLASRIFPRRIPTLCMSSGWPTRCKSR